MNDLDALLSAARSDLAADSPTADPAVADADVARGRRALSHRRMRRSAGRSALVAAVAIGGFAAVHPHGSAGSSTTASGPSSTAPATEASTATTATGAPDTVVGGSSHLAAIRLVSYTGAQPQGYTVDKVPSGWVVQGVDDYVLTIAPAGDKDTDPDHFVGKIVVMLESRDQQGVPSGEPVTVDGHPGTVVNADDGSGLESLYYADAAGHRLDIQVPLSLHWSNAQLAAFGASVHANASATPGVG